METTEESANRKRARSSIGVFEPQKRPDIGNERPPLDATRPLTPIHVSEDLDSPISCDSDGVPRGSVPDPRGSRRREVTEVCHLPSITISRFLLPLVSNENY